MEQFEKLVKDLEEGCRNFLGGMDKVREDEELSLEGPYERGGIMVLVNLLPLSFKLDALVKYVKDEVNKPKEVNHDQEVKQVEE